MTRLWRYLRITATTLIGLILLLLLLLVIASQLDINQFKKTIEAQVTALTGRQLFIDGDLHLELTLHPVLSIEKIRFANASWSDKPQMLSLEKLYLKIDLMSIFNNKLIVEKLLLEGLDLSVEINADGNVNWQLEKLISDNANATNVNTEAKPFQLPILPILKQVKIDNVHFYYNDSTSSIQTDVVIDAARLSNLDINKTFAFSANGNVNKRSFDLSGKTRFLTAVTAQNIADQGLKINIEGRAPAIKLTIDGKIEKPATAEGIDITLSLEVKDFDTAFIAVTGKSMYHPHKPSKPLPLNLSAKLIDIPDGYNLSEIKIKLENTDLSGNLSYTNQPERPKITVELSSKNINIDAFLPKKTKQLKQKNKPALDSPITSRRIKLPETILPFNQLKLLDADINLSVNTLQLEAFEFKKIKLNATLKNGLLAVKQLDLKLNKASIHGSLTVDSRNKNPRVNTKLNVNNLPLKLISQRLSLEQIKSGTLSSEINLKTRGKNIKSLLLNLKGKTNVQLLDVKFAFQLKNKNHNIGIKKLTLNYSEMNKPLEYNLIGQIDNEPLLLAGELNTPAFIINNETLKLKLRLAAFKVDIAAAGNIVNPLNANQALIDLTIDIPDPKTSIHKISLFIPEIKPNKNLAGIPINIRGKLIASLDAYRFENIQLKAGKNDLSGTIYANLKTKKPFIEAKLESQLIDLNELVPATILEKDGVAQPQEHEKENLKKTKLFSKEPLPTFDALNALDINLTYNLKKLTSNNQTIDNIYLNLALKDGQLKLDPLSIDFAKGTIKSNLVLSAANEAQFKLETKITQLDYDQLMIILGMKEYAKGELDAEIDLNGKGNSVHALMASLNGKVRVTAENGTLDSGALELLSKDLVSLIPFTDTSDRQKIKCAVVQFDINKGIVSTHAMVLNTGALSALGTGDINLAKETVNLYVAPRSKRTSVIKIALVPMNITGPLLAPSITPDIAGSTLSTTKTAANISLTIATGGVWLLAEDFANDLWGKFIDDTDYCAKALAGEKITPTRIKLEGKKNTVESNLLEDDDEDW